MRLRSGSPFWPIRDGLISNYPPLDEDVSCDVAVVGGGLSGAMSAYLLSETGADVVVLDKRDAGFGSTCASTALVMYEVDLPLRELESLRGRDYAVRSYRACLESVRRVESLVTDVGGAGSFRRKRSLYLASDTGEASELKEEYDARRRAGLRLRYLERDALKGEFSISRPAALLSAGAGVIDPFLTTHQLLDASRRRGARVYDRTAITAFEPNARGPLLTTDRGFRVRSKKVVFATGYETLTFLERDVVKLKSSYALVTEPVRGAAGSNRNYGSCVIWETRRPYLYLRTTEDSRVMVGGEDEDFVNPTRRDGLISKKSRSLLMKTERLIPEPDLEVAYAWAGTFGETEDSLPVIGAVEEVPNAYFSLCYGANGTNFALLGAEIIRDAYLGKPNGDAELFGFDRLDH